MTDISKPGPTPEGKVLIFGEEAFFHPLAFGADIAVSWEAMRFPFKGVIIRNECHYEWRLELHDCFHSRGIIGRGVRKLFEDALKELEDCARAYFKDMEWFKEE